MALGKIETLEVVPNPAEELTDSKVFVSYVVALSFGLLTYLIDLLTDCITAHRHFVDGHNNYAIVTLILVLSPSLAFAVFAVVKCIWNADLGFRKKVVYIPFYVICSAFLLLWPIWRYSQMVFYSIKAMKNKTKRNMYISKVKNIEYDDNTIIQIILEAFMESAPQSLFQFYIIFKRNMEQTDKNIPTEDNQKMTTCVLIVSTVISVISLSNVVVQCQINSEHHMTMTENKGRAYVIEYLWWFMSIGSRIVALAFFAAIFKELIFLICTLHCITITFCLIASRPQKRHCSDWPLMFVIGIIYIFCFVEYKVDFGQLGKTVGLYCLYYVFIFIQNTCMLFSAYFVSNYYQWKVPAMVFHYVAFTIAVGLMLFYLGLLRPVLIKRAKVKLRGFLKQKRETNV